MHLFFMNFAKVESNAHAGITTVPGTVHPSQVRWAGRTVKLSSMSCLSNDHNGFEVPVPVLLHVLGNHCPKVPGSSSKLTVMSDHSDQNRLMRRR